MCGGRPCLIQLCPWEPHPRDPSTSNESLSTSQQNRCSDAHHGAVTWACGPDWRKASQTTSCPPSTSRPSLHPPPAVFTPAWGSCSGRPMPSCPHQCVPASPAAPLPEPGARWKRPGLRCRPSPPQLPPPPQAPRCGAPRRTPASRWDPPPRAPCVTLPLGHRRAVFTRCADGRPCNTGWCCPGSFVCHLAIKPLRHPVL